MSNHTPVPSQTPIVVENCKTFDPVVGTVGRFLDLHMHVQTIINNLEYKNNLEYNIDFGDGERILGKKFDSESLKKTIIKEKELHRYKSAKTYNAILSVDDVKNKVRACASVPVYIKSETPDLCSEIHIQSRENDIFRGIPIRDFSENKYEIEVVGREEVEVVNEQGEIEVLFSDLLPYRSYNSSPYRDETSIEFFSEYMQYLEALDTKYDFRFIHNNTEEDWTIESWINLKSIQPISPIVLNSTKTGEIGFQLYIQNGESIIFSIFNNKKAVNVDGECRPFMSALPLLLCENDGRGVNPGIIARINQSYLFEVGNWYHIAVIKSGEFINIYINGEKNGKARYFTSECLDEPAEHNLFIGYKPIKDIECYPLGYSELPLALCKQDGSIGDHLDGYIQDLRIFKGRNQYERIQTEKKLISRKCFNSAIDPCPIIHIQSNNSAEDPIRDYSKNKIEIINQGGVFHDMNTFPYGISSFNFIGGESRFLEIKSHESINLGNLDFSFEFWFMVKEGNSGGEVIASNGESSEDFSISINEDYISFKKDDYELKYENLLKYNQWNHFLLVKFNNSLILYLNEIKVKYDYLFDLNFIQTGLIIGRGFEGYIQDLIITKKVLPWSQSIIPPEVPIPEDCSEPPILEPEPPTIATIVARCPYFLLQSNKTSFNNISLFEDTGINEFDVIIQQGNPAHQSDLKLFENSSIKFVPGDIIQVLDTMSFITSVSSEWTIQCWVYINDIETQKIFFNNEEINSLDYPCYFLSNAQNEKNGFKMYYHPKEYFGFEVYTNGSLKYDLRSSVAGDNARLYQWHHVAITLSRDFITLYVNGVESHQEPISFSDSFFSPDGNLLIGDVHYGNLNYSNPFDGYIQEISLFKGLMDRSNFPNFSTFSVDECLTKKAIKPECPVFHIKSDNQEGELVLNNYGSQELVPYIASTKSTHTKSDRILNSQSSIEVDEFKPIEFMSSSSIGKDSSLEAEVINYFLHHEFFKNILGDSVEFEPDNKPANSCWYGFTDIYLDEIKGNANIESMASDQDIDGFLLYKGGMSTLYKEVESYPITIKKEQIPRVYKENWNQGAKPLFKDEEDFTIQTWVNFEDLNKKHLIIKAGIFEKTLDLGWQLKRLGVQEIEEMTSYLLENIQLVSNNYYSETGENEEFIVNLQKNNYPLTASSDGAFYANYGTYNNQTQEYPKTKIYQISQEEINEIKNFYKNAFYFDLVGVDHWYAHLDRFGVPQVSNIFQSASFRASSAYMWGYIPRIKTKMKYRFLFFSQLDLEDDNWYHIALTRKNSTNFKMYINGAPSSSFQFTSSSRIKVGGVNDIASGDKIDEFTYLDGIYDQIKNPVDNNPEHYGDYVTAKYWRGLDCLGLLESKISDKWKTHANLPYVRIGGSPRDSMTELDINKNIEDGLQGDDIYANRNYGKFKIQDFSVFRDQALEAGNFYQNKIFESNCPLICPTLQIQSNSAAQGNQINDLSLEGNEIENIGNVYHDETQGIIRSSSLYFDGNSYLTSSFFEDKIIEDSSFTFSFFFRQKNQMKAILNGEIFAQSLFDFRGKTSDEEKFVISILSDYHETWDPGKIYEQNTLVFRSGKYFILESSNSFNQDPIDEGITSWKEIDPEPGKFYISIHKGDIFTPLIQTEVKFNSNENHHVGVVKNEDILELYINGSLISYVNAVGIFAGTINNITIGKDKSLESASQFNGHMQDIRLIYEAEKFSLTPNALTTLCNSEIRIPECQNVNLHIQSHADHEEVNGVFDFSKNNLEIKVINEEQNIESLHDTGSPIYSDSSLNFNGSRYYEINRNDLLRLNESFTIEFSIIFNTLPRQLFDDEDLIFNERHTIISHGSRDNVSKNIGWEIAIIGGEIKFYYNEEGVEEEFWLNVINLTPEDGIENNKIYHFAVVRSFGIGFGLVDGSLVSVHNFGQKVIQYPNVKINIGLSLEQLGPGTIDILQKNEVPGITEAGVLKSYINANIQDIRICNTDLYTNNFNIGNLGLLETCAKNPNDIVCDNLVLEFIQDENISPIQTDTSINANFLSRIIGKSYKYLNINSHFGMGDISIDGNTMAIGAPYHYHNEAIATSAYGAVFLFEKQENGSWLQTDIILPSRAQFNQGFGHGVELNGNELYIGVPFSSVNASTAGNVILYKKQTDGSWLEFESIKQAFPTNGDHFGSSISIAGNTMAVGAYADDESSDDRSNEGAVYIFERQTDDSWLQTHKILESSTNMTLFGFRVCLDGENLLAVSSYYANNTKGSVWLLEKQTDGSWSITDEVFPPNLINNGNYGSGLFFKGDQLFVGQNKNSEAGLNNGVVYIFTKQSDGSWLETSKIFDNTATADGERFGSSIELDGDILYVGSALSDDGKGVVKIIDLSGGSVVLPELTDLSSNKHALTNTGVDIFGHADLFNVSAMNFDGDGDYLTIGDTSTFKFLHDGTTDYTVEGWWLFNDLSDRRTFISSTGYSANVGFRILWVNNLIACTIDRGVQDSNFEAVIDFIPELNSWYHIATTFDSVTNTFSLYIDGQLRVQEAVNGFSASDSYRPITIGSSYDRGSWYDHNGSIQDLRISKKAVYTGNFTPPTNLLNNPC